MREGKCLEAVFYTMFKGKRGILDYVVSKPQQNDDEGFRRFADTEIAYHVKPQYRMTPEQRAAL